MLAKEEFKRYSRQIILEEVGYAGQEKLKAAKVLIIGAGGLGCPVVQYLTAAGVGTLGIIDDDKVDESNLHRQILYSVKDLGKNKAEVSAKKALELNPFAKALAFPEKLTTDNAIEIIKDFDIVVDGSDNFSTRYLVNDACIALNKPFVSSSVFQLEAQLSVFNYNGGPTYRCIFPEPPENIMNCSEAGVLGYLTGLAGTLQAGEVIKMILEKGEVLSGKLLVFDALKMEFKTIFFERNHCLSKAEQALFSKQL